MALVSFDHFSLRTKLIALISTLLAALSVFLVWFFPTRMDATANVWLERRAKGMAILLANAVAPGLEFEDATQVTQRLGGLDTAPDAVYAVVRKADGTVLASWHESDYQQVGPSLPDETYVERTGDVLHVVQPIWTKLGDKGALAVGFAATELEKEKQDYFIVVGGVSTGLFTAGVLAIFVIGTLLVRPIRRMTEVASEIAGGDLAAAEEALGGLAHEDERAEGSGGRVRRMDEVIQLARSFARMLVSLRDGSSTLHRSAAILSEAVENLTSVTDQQSEAISRQAAALQETQVSAQGIRDTSLVASNRARMVMQVVDGANAVTRSGEAAIDQTLTALGEIQSRVGEIARQITELRERASQIGGITDTVKELADQSNMLALNAAIEAARSNEQGKGFGVVAQEIRGLADQSVQAASRVGDILEDIGQAVQVAVSITEDGSKRIEGGLAQVKASGANLSELSTMVNESAAAVREIATAVNQQTAGFAQILSAVNDLSRMMDDAVRGIDSTKTAIGTLKEVSEGIITVAQRYRL